MFWGVRFDSPFLLLVLNQFPHLAGIGFELSSLREVLVEFLLHELGDGRRVVALGKLGD